MFLGVSLKILSINLSGNPVSIIFGIYAGRSLRQQPSK